MITLLTYPPAFGAEAASPFCIKAIWLLNLSGQPWQREDVKDPRKMPYGKLPAIRVDGRIIADSDNIRAHLESAGADFDAGLSDLDRANSRAFIRMAEEHLYFHVMMDRWGDDTVWPAVRDAYFDEIPKPLRGLITGRFRKDVLRALDGQGIGRLSPTERLARIEPDLAAIAARLNQGPFLFGETPTAADTSVAPMLDNIRTTPGTTLSKTRVGEDTALGAYIDRCRAAMGQTIAGSA